MQKITLTLDLNKLDKSRINNRTYTNKDGQEVTVREYQIDVVELKPEKKRVIKSGQKADGTPWTFSETHFACDTQTKEERDANTPTKFVGKGTSFEDVTSTTPMVENDGIPF